MSVPAQSALGAASSNRAPRAGFSGPWKVPIAAAAANEHADSLDAALDHAMIEGADLHAPDKPLDPSTPRGRRTDVCYAHELTHVVQQRQIGRALPSRGLGFQAGVS
jgi:hypothetical protein